MADLKTFPIAPPAVVRTGRYPWYAYLLSGYALTGAFCWLLVAALFRQNGRGRTAAAIIATNTLLLAIMIWAALRLEMAWWRLESLVLGFNLAWSMSAWRVQFRFFGQAEPRFRPTQWRRWGAPLAIGALIGAGIAVCAAVAPAISERVAAMNGQEAVVRSSILWQFFKGLPLGLALGVLTGFWWAGGQRFTTSHVISALAGISLILLADSALLTIFTLIVSGNDLTGAQTAAGDAWALVPGALHGWPKALQTFAGFHSIVLIPMGLLFGAPARIRDFLKRAAIVVPLLVGLGLPLSFFSAQSWGLLQKELVYQTTAPDEGRRDSALDWLQTMLARYPNHAQWPSLAARLADARYAQGATAKARALHQQIIDRFANANQWHTQVAMSRAIVSAPRFGQPSGGPRLTIPMINYQDYLTCNWMALLAGAHYWQNDQTPVSELLIRLREISKDDDEIELPNLTSLADLDDAASALGYHTTILPADPQAARALIEAGFPVLLPIYQTFYLIYGFDDTLGLVQAACFGQLSDQLKATAVQETQEVLMLAAEGQGRGKAQLARIGREATCTWPLEQWRNGRLKDAAPWMAVIYPEGKQNTAAAALGQSVDALAQAHRGLLTALIALSYFDNADPLNCIRWSQIAARSSRDPLVWHAAYLGDLLWRQRAKRIGAALQLEKKIPVLAEVDRFMESESVKRFLQEARQRYTQDLAADRLTWPVRWRLLWLLDREDDPQRRQMITLLRANLTTNPADAAQWRQLADLYALDDQPPARAAALAAAWSADPLNAATALAWARACVLLDDPAQADRVLERIDPAKVRHEADYAFCLGAVAEWRQQPRTALRYYAQATDMCRYRPAYFLRYGRLLMAQGDTAAAKKALAWAARIDGGERIREEAQHILAAQHPAPGKR